MEAMVRFLDKGRTATSPPNPKYPNGVIVDMSQGFTKRCDFKLPYPAPRCGVMHVVCNKCGVSVGITVAGRPDDPHTVIIGCHANKFMLIEDLSKNEKAFDSFLSAK
jgi:hypothetical protein